MTEILLTGALSLNQSINHFSLTGPGIKTAEENTMDCLERAAIMTAQ